MHLYRKNTQDINPECCICLGFIIDKNIRWMMDNIFIRRDPAGNIKPDKGKSTEKIDSAVAMIMALDRAIRCGCVSDESVYDSREMLVL